MADEDVFPPDVDADAERFVDDDVDDDELDPPERLGRHDEGSDADIVDQHRAVPLSDDDD
ncbi:MAG TPA: hypothetical protein VK860_12955 [Ilumatobacteraceae bacterium]|jgi:hypothetical protein|nr:hypothetical protein [Ilumatobacteraceae bacterium]